MVYYFRNNPMPSALASHTSVLNEYSPEHLRKHLIRRLFQPLTPGSDDVMLEAALKVAALNKPEVIIALAQKLSEPDIPSPSHLQRPQPIQAPVILINNNNNPQSHPLITSATIVDDN